MKIYNRFCAYLKHNYVQHLSEREMFRTKVVAENEIEFYVYYNFPKVLKPSEINKRNVRYVHVSEYTQEITLIFWTHPKTA
jgi:hypothetical protein